MITLSDVGQVILVVCSGWCCYKAGYQRGHDAATKTERLRANRLAFLFGIHKAPVATETSFLEHVRAMCPTGVSINVFLNETIDVLKRDLQRELERQTTREKRAN